MASQVSRPIYNALDITPAKKRWTVLVQVVQRNMVKDSRSTTNSIKYRSYLVTDMEGTRVGMVTYGSDIPFFDATLVPYKRYYISNAYVKKAKDGYQVSDYRYCWTLTSSTLVEPVMDVETFNLLCAFDFTPFSEFTALAEQETSIAIKALVVKAFSWKVINDGLEAKDYVVVDNENMPILMRTWKNTNSEVPLDLGYTLPDPLFIVATNVRVTAYNGLSLTTRYSTVFLQDPPIHEDVPLKEWYKANVASVNEKLIAEAYKDVSTLIKRPEPDSILQIEQVIRSISELKTAWIKGAIKLVPGQKKFWYTCCSNCNKSISGDVGWVIWCESCKENSEIDLRYNFEVSMEDGTDTICVTLYASDAQKLLPFTISELAEETEQGKDVESKIRTAIGGKQIVCFIKHYDKNIRDASIRKYPVIRMFYHNEVFGEAMVTAHNSAPNSPHTESSEAVLMVVDKTVVVPVEKQLFSPTTKNTLEEIAATCEAASLFGTQPSVAKRGITFENVASTYQTSDALLQVLTNSAAIPAEPNPTPAKTSAKKPRTKSKTT